MTTPQITALPTAPSRATMNAAAFNTAADAWVAAMGPFTTQANAVAVACDADAVQTAADRVSTTASAASAINAPGTNATSTTSVAVGTGSKAFTIQTGKSLVVGQYMSAASAANATNNMVGIITAYNSGTGALTLQVSITSGSGTYADWVVGLTAVPAGLGTFALWIPAAAMLNCITNSPAFGLFETTTNKVQVRTWDFDPNTNQFAQFDIRMPKSWDLGTVKFVPVWSHPATTTNFKASWGMQAVAISAADALDAAFGTAQTSYSTGGTTDTMYTGAQSAAITIAGSPAAEDLVVFQVYRDAVDATNDTLAVNARLMGITLLIQTNTGSDA